MLTQIELLKKYHLRIRGHLGQHLLLDPNITRKIVDGLELCPGERVFEIGPGLGAVSREVLGRGFPLLAIEKDARFVEVLNQELAPEHGENFRLIHADILQSNLTEIIQQWTRGEDKVKVVANLPYYISTPILFHLIDHAKVFSRAVLMLQKEVAQRLTAVAGEKDYSRLSVMGRFYGETRFLFDVSPGCFLPPPKVVSRVISFFFRPHPAKSTLPNEALLREIVRLAFGQRRKLLLPLLLRPLRPPVKREVLESIFKGLGLPGKVRGEELSPEVFIALADALSKSGISL